MNPLPSASLSHNRRAFLREGSLGIGSLALAWLLQQEQAAASPAKLPIAPPRVDLLPRPPHHQPRAKAMISLFMHGGPSHMDLTDPKPELTRLNGTEYPGDIAYSFVNEASKKLLGSRWSFAKHGRCGTEVSELLPGLASIVDVCLLRGMHTGANGHEVSIRYFHGGIPGVLGRPHMASWLLYGLGSETQNLPAYMVLTDPGGLPVDGVTNWSSGFMPPIYQGTVIRPTEPRILNLDPPPHLAGAPQRQNLDLLASLNRLHAERFPGQPDLESRIASYELAARMQTAARDALDITQETRSTLAMYGIDEEPTREYGTRCLIARRLVERGVRFVQLFLAGPSRQGDSGVASASSSLSPTSDTGSGVRAAETALNGTGFGGPQAPRSGRSAAPSPVPLASPKPSLLPPTARGKKPSPPQSTAHFRRLRLRRIMQPTGGVSVMAISLPLSAAFTASSR